MAELPGFENILLLLGMGGLFGLLVSRFGYPSVVGYILAGVAYSIFFEIELEDPLVVSLGTLGIILLSFNIGLETKLDFFSKYYKEIVSVIVMDFAITYASWTFFGGFMGLNTLQQLILTVITICASSGALYKMLTRGSYRKEFKQLVFSMLAIQDVVVIVALTLITTGPEKVDFQGLARLAALLMGYALVSFYIGRRFMKWVLSVTSRHNVDVYLIVVLSLALGYSFIAGAIGLSSLYGAFIAGMVISSVSDPREATYRLQGLLELGLLLYFSLIGAQVREASLSFIAMGLGIALISVIVRAISFTISAWSSGFSIRDSIKAGLLMTNISENGLVLASAAVASGIFTREHLAMVTIMVLGSFLISSPFYRRIEPLSENIEKKIPPAIVNAVENVVRKYYTRASAVIVKVSWLLLEGFSLLFIITLTISHLESKLGEIGAPYLMRAALILVGLVLVMLVVHFSVKRIVKIVPPIDVGFEEIELEDAAKVISFAAGALISVAFIMISLRYTVDFFQQEITQLGLPHQIIAMLPVMFSLVLFYHFAKNVIRTYRELKFISEKQRE